MIVKVFEPWPYNFSGNVWNLFIRKYECFIDAKIIAQKFIWAIWISWNIKCSSANNSTVLCCQFKRVYILGAHVLKLKCFKHWYYRKYLNHQSKYDLCKQKTCIHSLTRLPWLFNVICYNWSIAFQNWFVIFASKIRLARRTNERYGAAFKSACHMFSNRKKSNTQQQHFISFPMKLCCKCVCVFMNAMYKSQYTKNSKQI